MSDIFDHYGEAFERELNGEGYDDVSFSNKTCKYCGETMLHWVDTPRGWRLFDVNDKQHFCNNRME